MTSFPLMPGETRVIEPEVVIPANFGEVTVKFTIYDVIDTLDIILPGQEVAEKTITQTFNVPKDLKKYMDEAIAMPPMVANSPDFDSEFSRLLLLMIKDGLDLSKIAEMANADKAFIADMLKNFEKQRYLRKVDAKAYEMMIPIISLDEAKDGLKLAEKASTELADLIEKNLPGYHLTLDSMVEVGLLTADSNDFLSGGTILYRPYPIVSGMALWYDYGQAFIDRERPLQIFEGTDPCHAHIPRFNYLVRGGSKYNGEHFYNLLATNRELVIAFADTIPIIECTGDLAFQARRMVENHGWAYSTKNTPEAFMIDTAKVHIALRKLRLGIDPLIEKWQNQLQELMVEYKHEQFKTNMRYWYWNLVATHALDKLVERGFLMSDGEIGFYRVEKTRW